MDLTVSKGGGSGALNTATGHFFARSLEHYL